MGINGHPVALRGCLNGIRKRKAMEELRYKELDAGLYMCHLNRNIEADRGKRHISEIYLWGKMY